MLSQPGLEATPIGRLGQLKVSHNQVHILLFEHRPRLLHVPGRVNLMIATAQEGAYRFQNRVVVIQ